MTLSCKGFLLKKKNPVIRRHGGLLDASQGHGYIMAHGVNVSAQLPLMALAGLRHTPVCIKHWDSAFTNFAGHERSNYISPAMSGILHDRDGLSIQHYDRVGLAVHAREVDFLSVRACCVRLTQHRPKSQFSRTYAAQNGQAGNLRAN
jgi:hypothetical protein